MQSVTSCGGAIYSPCTTYHFLSVPGDPDMLHLPLFHSIRSHPSGVTQQPCPTPTRPRALQHRASPRQATRPKTCSKNKQSAWYTCPIFARDAPKRWSRAVRAVARAHRLGMRAGEFAHFRQNIGWETLSRHRTRVGFFLFLARNFLAIGTDY